MHGEGQNHNPNKNRIAWNKGLTKELDIRIKNYSQSIKNSWFPRGAVLLSSAQLSENAKRQGFGGYRENAGRSKKYKVFDTFGNSVTLQSSFELNCSEILAELSISWIRPKALKYDDKKYFADFYLPDFDIWLDPKNDFKAVQDIEKILAVIKQNNIKLFVLSESQITKSYIASLIQ